MRKILAYLGLVAAVVAVVLAFYSSANAGLKYQSTVYIGASLASGSIGATRNSANTTEHIGCAYQTKKTSSGTYESSVYCYATDAASNHADCRSSAPAMLEAVKSLNDDSYLAFRYVGVVGSRECTEITIYNDSGDPPRVP